MSTTASPIDRLRELGGELFLSGDVIRYRIPAASPEAHKLLAEIRKDREAVLAMLQDQEGYPPTLEEIQSALPSGVTLVSYQPKQTPFDVAPVNVVTNAGKFFRAYLKDLNRRLEHPNGHASPPLADILSKLADAGLELKIAKPGAFMNVLGLEVSDDDIPF
jgi:hypothetical protein